MLAINPAGIAACLTPGTRGSDGTYTVDVYLMVGDMPPAEFLEEITSATELITTFPQVTKKFNGLSIETKFDFGINERTYKKVPVDALPFTPEQDGEIKWAAIVFPGEKIMYTDSVGEWDDVEACITVMSITATSTTENVLKDINLVIRDKSTYELYPNGISSMLA